MADEYPPEQLQEIYETLPDNLKEALFSEKNADDVYNICVENGLEEKYAEVAKYLSYVLCGLLSPNDFEKTLAEKLALENETAKKVSQEITRLVFLPLKESLEALYSIEIKPVLPEPAPSTESTGTAEPQNTSEPIIPAEPEKPKEPVKTTEKKIEKKSGKDTYREPIE
jgi:hypothetical protein